MVIPDHVAGEVAEAIASRMRSFATVSPELLRLRRELLEADVAFRAAEAHRDGTIDGWLTAAEAARRFGVTPSAVRQRCRNGSLESRRTSKGWRIRI